MKLSEAILLGSVGTKQATGRFLSVDGKTCAMGAAMVAAGLDLMPVPMGPDNYGIHRHNALAVHESYRLWPYLLTKVQSPMSAAITCNLQLAIESLNDIWGWTRPQIAAWVATIEDQLEKETQNGGILEEEVQLGQVRA